MSSIEFLIRSASSLLSIIDQQVEVPHSAGVNRSVRFLDRIALLFVTKAKQDVTAVSAVLTPNRSILVGCTEASTDSPPPESAGALSEYILLSKNSRNAKSSPSTDCPPVLDRSSSLAMYEIDCPTRYFN